MMKTSLTHAAIAIVIQLVMAMYFNYMHGISYEHGIIAGGFVACSGFLFREIAQHEYKGGGPLKVSILYGLTNHWTMDSILDVLLPIIMTGAVWVVLF